ncbi:MAG: DUF2723 domain-containing protein [Acidobacteria bacterium]|nr:DUF2723 domain-containing protein [Acidobacteriota bacterium]
MNEESGASLRLTTEKVNYNARVQLAIDTRRHRRWALSISLVALVFYTATLLPGIDWNEGAKSQLRALRMIGGSGATDHPVYFWLGNCFSKIPAADRAWPINLSSSIYSALAVLLFALAGFEILQISTPSPASPTASLQHAHPPVFPILSRDPVSPAGRAISWSVTLASASLGLSHAFWFCATHPRPLSLNGAVFAAVIYCTISAIRKFQNKKVFTLCFLLGLSAGIYLYTVLLAPLFLYFVAKSDHQGRLKLSKGSPAAAAGFFCLGLAPYLVTLLRDIAQIKLPFLIVASAAGLPFGLTQNTGEILMNEVGRSFLLLTYNFFPWGIVVAALGIWSLRRQSLLLLLLAACFVGNWLLTLPAFAYPTLVQYHPAWMAFAMFLAPGWHWLLTRHPKLASPAVLLTLCFPPVFYHWAPSLFNGSSLLGGQKNLRQPFPLAMDAQRYGFNPNGHRDDSARRYGESLLRKLPRNAHLLAYHRIDPSTYFIVSFLQKSEHRRLDLIVDNLSGHNGIVALEHHFGLHPESKEVYLSGLHSLYNTQRAKIEPIPISPGFDLYRVTWTSPQASTTALPSGDSYWAGNITLLDSSLRLHVIPLDGLWHIRLRFGNLWLYPHEARVDHLKVEPGSVSFTYAGLNFIAKIFGKRMLGEWWFSPRSDLHGAWEATRLDREP